MNNIFDPAGSRLRNILHSLR